MKPAAGWIAELGSLDETRMITPPTDMLPELSEWNNGQGIDLAMWVACSGDFRLAVGYTTVFWPQFVLFGDYILREGFSIESLRGFEAQCKGDQRAVEALLNHLHIADIQAHGCEDITPERIRYLGRTLTEIYAAKLAWQFSDRPCEVEFIEPEDAQDLIGYQITFWQKKHVERSSRPNGGPVASTENPNAPNEPRSVS